MKISNEHSHHSLFLKSSLPPWQSLSLTDGLDVNAVRQYVLPHPVEELQLVDDLPHALLRFPRSADVTPEAVQTCTTTHS